MKKKKTMKKKKSNPKHIVPDNNRYIDPNTERRQEEGLIKPLFMSLFCGTGGSSLGYRWADYKEILAVDYDEHAVQCFAANFPDVPVKNWDLVEKSPENLLTEMNVKVGELDLLDGSSSCVNLSRSNTEAELYAISNKLFWKLALFVAEIQPKVFLFENVEGLLDKRNLGILLEQKRRLNTLNYVWGYAVFKAEEYGVPQQRRRVIFIGIRKDVYIKSSKASLFPLPNPDGAAQMALSKVLPNLSGCSPGQFNDDFQFGNKPMCTITKTASLWVHDKEGIKRKPTIEELKVASTFPANFKFHGSFTQQWARIGNAVPPKLIQAFAQNLNVNFLNPYLASDNHTKKEYEKLVMISNHFKQFGFKKIKDSKLKF